jgi:hypothetical protein
MMHRIFSLVSGDYTITLHFTKRNFALTEYLKRKILSFAVTRLFFSSRLYETEEQKILMLEYFGSIDGREGWSANKEIAATYTRNLR